MTHEGCLLWLVLPVSAGLDCPQMFFTSFFSWSIQVGVIIFKHRIVCLLTLEDCGQKLPWKDKWKQLENCQGALFDVLDLCAINSLEYNIYCKLTGT